MLVLTRQVNILKLCELTIVKPWAKLALRNFKARSEFWSASICFQVLLPAYEYSQSFVRHSAAPIHCHIKRCLVPRVPAPQKVAFDLRLLHYRSQQNAEINSWRCTTGTHHDWNELGAPAEGSELPAVDLPSPSSQANQFWGFFTTWKATILGDGDHDLKLALSPNQCHVNYDQKGGDGVVVYTIVTPTWTWNFFTWWRSRLVSAQCYSGRL